MNAQEKAIQEDRIEKYSALHSRLCEIKATLKDLDNHAFTGNWSDARKITGMEISFSLPNGKGGTTVPRFDLDDVGVSAFSFCQWLRGELKKEENQITEAMEKI